MTTYQITIRKQSIVQKVIEFIAASNALEAINFVEVSYDYQTFELSNRNGNKQKVK